MVIVHYSFQYENDLAPMPTNSDLNCGERKLQEQHHPLELIKDLVQSKGDCHRYQGEKTFTDFISVLLPIGFTDYKDSRNPYVLYLYPVDQTSN